MKDVIMATKKMTVHSVTTQAFLEQFHGIYSKPRKFSPNFNNPYAFGAAAVMMFSLFCFAKLKCYINPICSRVLKFSENLLGLLY